MPAQIDIFGGEHDLSKRPVDPNAPMSRAQIEILRLAARPEGVRPVEAGEILHRARRLPCAEKRYHDRLQTQTGRCCRFASSDGWDALKRLKARGLVDQPEPRGPYYGAKP